MKKIFLFILIALCSRVAKSQSAIPVYVVHDTTILAAYSGTNTLASVKDTGTTGGLYIYDATGTYVPDGTVAFVTSVKGGIWLHVATGNGTATGGGGSNTDSLFGIQDNVGIQDRSVDMTNYGMTWNISGINYLTFHDDASFPYFESYFEKDNTHGERTDFYQDYGQFTLSNVTDAGNVSNYINANPTDNILLRSTNSSAGEDRFLYVRPTTVTIKRSGVGQDNTEHEIATSVSVNGGSPNYADSTGNIDISTTFSWVNLFSASFTAAGGIAGSTTNYGQVTGRASGWLAESGVQFVMSEDFTMSRLFITTSTSQPAGGDLVITFRKNGSNTALTVTIPTGSSAGTFSDITHTVSVAAGDLIDWQIANGSGSTSATIISIGATATGN